ncbi:hypothetical protein D3C87_2178000 [compost metagenome]
MRKKPETPSSASTSRAMVAAMAGWKKANRNSARNSAARPSARWMKRRCQRCRLR